MVYIMIESQDNWKIICGFVKLELREEERIRKKARTMSEDEWF